MKNFASLFVTAFLVYAAAFSAEARESDRTLPTPPTVSREVQKLIAAQPCSYWNDHPKSAQEWKTWADARRKEGAKGLDDLRKQLGVTVTPGNMDGVPIFTFTWTDLTKTGDSYFTNQGVDNVLVSYGGWLGDAARLYAGEHDLKDPMISPGYGVSEDFRPRC